ncbi:hypothetical protein FPQ18DRAFT_329012 [Pyronema domesticum]|nr:hypothetical protein FPQ18DRAFT_329012 [Pyronema domesticum]
MVQKSWSWSLFLLFFLCWAKSFLYFSFLFLLCIIAWGFGCFLFSFTSLLCYGFYSFQLSFLFSVFC